MNQAETLAAITEASKLATALMQVGPGAFITGGTEQGAARVAAAFATIFSQIKQSAES